MYPRVFVRRLEALLMYRCPAIFKSIEPRLNSFLAETNLTADPHSRESLLTGELVDAGLGNLQGLCHFICL